MRMKSYFANSFRVAMEQARKELGPEAMLVTTRTAALEARHLGEYEVVFASDLPPAENTAPAPKETVKLAKPAPGEFTRAVFPQIPAAAPPAPTPSTPSAPNVPNLSNVPSNELLSMLEEIRQQIQSKMKPDETEETAAIAVPPGSNNLVKELVERDVSPQIAERLVMATENRLRGAGVDPKDEAKLRAALFEEIQNSFQVDSRLAAAHSGGAPLILALVGPPGAGKTATIAKLAVRFGLATRKPSVLLSLDTMRVGASEQLRCYASLLGLGFQTVQSNRALQQSLEENRGKELILIDTPGYTLPELSQGCDAAEFLSRRTDIQKYLVLPASMRSADTARIAAGYEVFKPSRLIFTRMDETESHGAVLNEAIRSGRPIAFFATGQRVPEDFSDATRRELAAALLPAREVPSSQLSASRPVDSFQTAA